MPSAGAYSGERPAQAPSALVLNSYNCAASAGVMLITLQRRLTRWISYLPHQHSCTVPELPRSPISASSARALREQRNGSGSVDVTGHAKGALGPKRAAMAEVHRRWTARGAIAVRGAEAEMARGLVAITRARRLSSVDCLSGSQ